MITPISFDPCKMDYPSWLTVSGFIMAVLLFFMSESHNSKNKFSPFSATIFEFGVTILIVMITMGILCFIYNIEYIGAILVTIVLSILPFYFLIFYWSTRLKQNDSQKSKIDELRLAYQPSIDFDE